MHRLLLALVLLSALPCQSQDHDLAEAAFAATADALLAETLDLFEAVPGVAVAVVKDGRTVYARGVGWADLEGNVPVTADTPFYIASATKPFTALLATLLDRDESLPLETSLAALFPDVAFDLEADSVTVRHLLSHTAGIDNAPIGFRAAYTGQHTPGVMRRLLHGTTDREGAPRGAYAYTNVGYNVLSVFLDDRRPWQDQLAAQVFQPLGMTRTTAYASQASEWSPAVPYTAGLDGQPERIHLVKHDDTMQAAGGMYASANDLARWLKAHLGDGMIDGRRVFPSEAIREVHRPVVTGRDESYGPFGRDGYALGWHTGTFDGEPMLHHLGGFSGFHTHTSFMPDRDLGVVVLTNESGAGGRVALRIAQFVYEWHSAEPEEQGAATERFRSDRADLLAAFEGYLEYANAQAEERADRSSQLSLAPPFYVGTYENPTWGTIEVAERSGDLVVRFGRLHAVASPHIEAETVRVELIPGSGQGIAFDLEDGTVSSLRYDGQTFARSTLHYSGSDGRDALGR